MQLAKRNKLHDNIHAVKIAKICFKMLIHVFKQKSLEEVSRIALTLIANVSL